jgi:hypothetical protein
MTSETPIDVTFHLIRRGWALAVFFAVMPARFRHQPVVRASSKTASRPYSGRIEETDRQVKDAGGCFKGGLYDG